MHESVLLFRWIEDVGSVIVRSVEVIPARTVQPHGRDWICLPDAQRVGAGSCCLRSRAVHSHPIGHSRRRRSALLCAIRSLSAVLSGS